MAHEHLFRGSDRNWSHFLHSRSCLLLDISPSLYRRFYALVKRLQASACTFYFLPFITYIQKKPFTKEIQMNCLRRLLFSHFCVELPLMFVAHEAFKVMSMGMSLPLPSWYGAFFLRTYSREGQASSGFVSDLSLLKIFTFTGSIDYFTTVPSTSTSTRSITIIQVTLPLAFLRLIFSSFRYGCGVRPPYRSYLFGIRHSARSLPFGRPRVYYACVACCSVRSACVFISPLVLLMDSVIQTIEAHAGFDFPFSPRRLIPFFGGAEYHDFHHETFVRLVHKNVEKLISVWEFCEYLHHLGLGFRN